MYCAFFGLQEKPFSVTPDPRFLFLSASHQEAFAHLRYGIGERKGFTEITGEVGTGKTVLCRALLERLGPHVQTALIFNSFLSEVELLRAINEDFGIPAAGTTRKALIDELNCFLIRGFRDRRNAIVIIDEAQNLAPSVLEQLRMLSNLEAEGSKLLQIVLVGQPELRELLDRPDLRQLNQRIAVRYHIQPLDRRATADYINHRLLVAGSHGGIRFSRRALSRIYQDSQGIPRKINLLCDHALLTAYVRGTSVIDQPIVRHASAELEGSTVRDLRTSGMRARWRRRLIAGGAAAGIALLLVGTFWRIGFHLTHLEGPAGTPSPTERSSEAVQVEGSMAGPSPDLLEPARATSNGVQATMEPNNAEWPTVDIRLRALLWEYTRALRQGGGGKKPMLVTMAAGFGLDVLPIWIDLHRLKRFRVASVMETFSPAAIEPTFFIPQALSSDHVELMDAFGNIQRFTNPELAKIWFGRAYLFYGSGTELQSILSQGKQGSELEALQRQLRELGYLVAAPSGTFDAETAAAVRRFQRDQHLQVDGVVGRATKIMLYHLSGQPLHADMP
jgi:general secretion pathway protein A